MILLASIALRMALVGAGGQGYWPDEVWPSGFTGPFMAGDIPGALQSLRNAGSHLPFRIVGIIPDAIAYFTGIERAPAYFFGLVSVLHIWLLWRFARRAGATEFQAAAAATLLAAATSFFYYSRHLLQYDLAMAFALMGLNAGVGQRMSARHSVASGFLAALGFFSYAGYWTMVPAVYAIHVTHGGVTWGTAARRTLLFGAGAATAAGAVIASVIAVTGQNLLTDYSAYASRITQGSFAEGWSLPFEYLWSAEHAVLVVWAAAVLSALWHLRRAPLSPVVRHGLLGLAVLYGILAVSSTVLERFVVYGRLARQMVPFFCLVAACEIDRLRTQRIPARRAVMSAAAAIVLGQVAWNMWQPFRPTFPDEFREEYEHLVSRLDTSQYVWVNADHIYPAPDPVTLPSRYTVLAEARHALQFDPYLYEGYKPEERAVMRSSDLTMRLIRFEP